MDAFCKARGENRKSVVFMYKGKEVRETDTPASISFKEGDIIEVHDK